MPATILPPTELFLLHEVNSTRSRWSHHYFENENYGKIPDSTCYEAYLIFPCTTSNAAWSLEDQEWRSAPSNLTKEIKKLVYTSTHNLLGEFGVDIMEIYSPPTERSMENRRRVGPHHRLQLL